MGELIIMGLVVFYNLFKIIFNIINDTICEKTFYLYIYWWYNKYIQYKY